MSGVQGEREMCSRTIVPITERPIFFGYYSFN